MQPSLAAVLKTSKISGQPLRALALLSREVQAPQSRLFQQPCISPRPAVLKQVLWLWHFCRVFQCQLCLSGSVSPHFPSSLPVPVCRPCVTNHVPFSEQTH